MSPQTEPIHTERLNVDGIPWPVQVDYYMEPEDIPVRGNLVSTDDKERDRQEEDEVLDRLEHGDWSAWFTGDVVARTLDGAPFEGWDSLGCITMAPEDTDGDVVEHLKECGVRDAAIRHLKEQVQSVKEALYPGVDA